MAISTNGTVIARLAGGLYNQTLSNTTYNEVVAIVKSAADINAIANDLYARDFASKTDLQVATTLLANLGLSSVAGLNNWVAAQLTSAGAAGKGAKIVSLLNDFSNLTSDATYGAAASSFNTKVDAALALSQTAGSKGGDLNAAATLAAAEAAAKAAAEAAAKASADAAAKAAADAAAKAAADKATADAAAKAAADKAAADAAAKAAADAAAKTAADAAAAKAASDAAAAKAAADAAAAEAAPKTFTLTTNADGFTGGSGADTFNGYISGTATILTATTGDVLNGGLGSDSLNLTVVDAANPGLLQTTGIENISIRALAATTVDALLIDGYTQLSSNAGTSAVTVNNASLAATHAVSNSISGNAANLTVNYRGADVAGTADVAKLSVSSVGSSVTAAGASSPTITRVAVAAGAGVEKITLATAGTNFVTVNGQATTDTLTITGNGTNNIDVGTLKAASTIDASTSTGTNTLNIGSALTTGDVITGGTGTDTVTFTAAETATVTVSGVETLQVDGGTRTTTFSANPALTNLNVRSASDAITMAGLTTLSNLNYQGSAAATYAGTSANVTLNTAFAGTNDTVAVTIGNRGVTANGSYNAGTLSVSGVENVTLTQSDMLATGTTTFSLKDTGLKTISATTAGSLALTLNTKADSAPLFSGTASTTGSNTVTSVNFSGVTGTSSSITFDAGTFAAAATVVAATGGSTFVTSTETSSDVITFTGGAGVDSFTTGTAGTYVATLGGGATNVFNASALAAATTGNTAHVTGGEGADTITTGANADTVVGGAGDDIITGGLGADVVDGGLGSDTYRVAVGVAAVSAVAEVQTITPAAGTTAVSDAAAVLVAVVGGKTVSVPIPAGTAVASTTVLIANALNAASGGTFAAVASSTAVTITHSTSSGNVAPIQLKLGVDGTLTTVGTAVTDTGSVFDAGGTASDNKETTFAIATTTQGVAAVAATSSDSPSTGSDLLTFVSNADIIDVVAGAIVITGGVAAGTTPAAAGNAAISTAGLATFEASDNTLALKITAVAADLDGTAAVREAAVFEHAGQAYLYISDGVAGHTSGDILITLTGITTVTTGITLNAGGDIIAIA